MKKETKKSNRRHRCKYPALERSLNIKTRRYYIETEYVNGVYDDDGREIFRPLTDEEKAWLNKFYEETIVTKFNKDDTDFYNSTEERRALWRENNRRNKCLFNVKQRSGKLKSYEQGIYDRTMTEMYGHLDYEMMYINRMEIEGEDEDGNLVIERLWDTED